MKQLAVHNLPRLVAPRELAGGAVVVIDLLRASTTICTALASGAAEVVTFLEVEQALAAVGTDRSGVVLGGERRGDLIAGFDLGNSPQDYTPDRVAGKRIVFTTTNGTRALEHARRASRILVGAMVNLSAVASAIQKEAHVHILCAGTDGQVTEEDILAAGALVERLTAESPEWNLTEPAKAARRQWREVESAARAAGRSVTAQLAEKLRDTPGGTNLLALGHDRDLAACAKIDALRVVPEFDPASGRITLRTAK